MAAVNIGFLQANLHCGLILTNKWSYKGLHKSIALEFRSMANPIMNLSQQV